MSRELTPEDIARHYTSALDSVDLIDQVDAGTQDFGSTEENVSAVERNVAHLRIILARDYWTTEDLTPFQDAVTKGDAYVATNSGAA